MSRSLQRWSGSSRTSRAPFAPQPRFQPHLETLDARLLPTVSVGLSPTNPSMLIIRGDASDNAIEIVQDDLANTLQVNSLDGQFASQQFASDAITTIFVKLRGDNDLFGYRTAANTNFTHAKTIKVDPGAGNDEVFFVFHDHTTIQAALDLQIGTLAKANNTGNDVVATFFDDILSCPVTVKADLGAGRDQFLGNFGGEDGVSLLSGTAEVVFSIKGGLGKDFLEVDGATEGDVVLAPSAYLGINLAGQADTDTIGAFFSGLLEGVLAINGRGGAGDDFLGGRVETQSAALPSDGYLVAVLAGSKGDDTLGLSVVEEMPGQLEFESAVIRGGAGVDVLFNGYTTDNVEVQGVFPTV
jgi:hypothetical protein